MRLESDTSEQAERSSDHPLTVRTQRPIYGLGRQDHCTGGNAADDSSALEHLAKFDDDLGVRVSVEKVFGHSTREPDTSGARDRFDEGIRIGNGAFEGVEHSHILRALRFESGLRRI